MFKLLSVPYFAQNDNEDWGSAPGNVQCCPTSNAMLAFYLNPGRLKRSQVNGFAEPESYYKYLMGSMGFSEADRGNHDAHTHILSEYFRIDSVWRTDLMPKDFKDSIDKGYPVVCGLEYKEDGHIALAVGYSDTGLLISDPYGIRAGTADYYSEINPGYGDMTGKEDGYSWSALEKILFNGGGWGRIVTRVRP